MHHLLLASRSMALAVDVMHGRGQSNKCAPSYSPQCKIVLAVSMAAKGIMHTVHY